MVSRELFGWSPPHIQTLTPVSEVSEPPESPSLYIDPGAETSASQQVEVEEEIEEPEEVEPTAAAVPFCRLFACADHFDWFLGKMPSFTRSRRGQRIKHDSHKEYAAYNSALMKTIKGATTGLISGTLWVLLLPPGIMFLVLRETLLFQAS
ncbi:hypothetical protein HN51_067295 [Arachis hypogaea]